MRNYTKLELFTISEINRLQQHIEVLKEEKGELLEKLRKYEEPSYVP